MQQVTINDLICDVADDLEGFKIQQLPSSTIEYVGYKNITQQLFVQFNSGKSYIYDSIPQSILLAAIRAESLTKYLMPELRGKTFTRIDHRLITIANI